MEHSVWIGIVMVAGVLLHIPMLRKPLSEDDGNWFYLAVFWKRGARLFKNNLRVIGYFGIQWMTAVLYNGIGWRDVRFFYVYKSCWYIGNALSVYWLVSIFSAEGVLPLIAALLFLMVTAIPNTLFFLTYAENFLILPINLGIIFSYYGFLTGHMGYFLLAGLMAGWAVQIKPIALLPAFLLPVSFLFLKSPLVPCLFYFTAFVGLNLFPMLLLRGYGKAAVADYLLMTFGPVLSLLAMFLERFKGRPFMRFLPDGLHDEQFQIYIRQHYQMDSRQQGAAFKQFMLPAVKDLYPVLILAAVQIILLFREFDPLAFAMALLFVVFLLTQQFQKNYYTPHFNSCWAPLSVLAAMTINDLLPVIRDGGLLGWTLAFVLAIPLFTLFRTIVRSYARSQADVWGYMGSALGSLFRLAGSLGRYVRQHSNEADRLLVWGDQPSIHLYAEREAFDPGYLILYAHHRRIHDPREERKLVDALRENPPEWIVFYNYKVDDGWNMQRLSDAIGIPYRLQQDFRLTDPQGNVIRTQNGATLDFPLYRRDDRIYKEILVDKAIAALTEGGTGVAVTRLEKALHLYPGDYEATVRLILAKGGDIDVPKGLEDRQGESPKSGDSGQAAILLRVLAEADLQSGRLDSALKRYMKARELNPEDFRTYNGLGEACLHIGKDQQAFRFFQKAVELNPFSADAYNNLGVLLARSGKREDAIACFRKSLAIVPGHPDTLNNVEALNLQLNG